jgi:hypothetical protein
MTPILITILWVSQSSGSSLHLNQLLSPAVSLDEPGQSLGAPQESGPDYALHSQTTDELKHAVEAASPAATNPLRVALVGSVCKHPNHRFSFFFFVLKTTITAHNEY